MKNPIQPMAKKTFYAARNLRIIFFLIIIIPISYLFYSLNSWIGLILTVIASFFWYLEIRRGNKTEDYIIENHENPLT